MEYIEKILLENGFNSHRNPNGRHVCVIENLRILEYESLIKYIDVDIRREHNLWRIYINFEDDILEEQNFGLCVDVDGYKVICKKYIRKEFDNKNDFIEELHRLNTIGLNIKG